MQSVSGFCGSAAFGAQALPLSHAPSDAAIPHRRYVVDHAGGAFEVVAIGLHVPPTGFVALIVRWVPAHPVMPSTVHAGAVAIG
jgi:hypothetical protein